MTPSLSEIERLEGLARAATPGERFWKLDKSNQATSLMTSGAGAYVLSAQADIGNYGLSVDCWIDMTDADEAFIAAANPQTILSLTQALRESMAIVALADELVNGGGLINRGVDRGLVVVEKADRSDPHYRLCLALEARTALRTGGDHV